MLKQPTIREALIALVALIIIEALGPWSLTSQFYKDLIQSIQKGEPLRVRYGYMAIAYVIAIVTLFVFALPLAKISLWYPFILGLCTYGFMNFSNIALINGYKLSVALLDTVWGGILFWAICWITLQLSVTVQDVKP